MTQSVTERDQQHEKRLLDKALVSNQSLWNSLLTGNGLILASAAFLASSSHWDQFFLLILILLVALAGFELVVNFRAVKVHYMDLGEDWVNRDKSGYQEKVTKKGNLRKHKATERREITALTLTALEMLLIGLMILY